MSKFQIEHVNPRDLTPYEFNPRKNKDAVKAVAESIKIHGFTQPIVINHEGTICIGHTRWAAAVELCLQTIPVVRKRMNEQQFIDLNIRDNKTAEFAKWDNKKLKHNLQLLDDLENFRSIGFEDGEIDKIFGHKHNETSNSSGANFGDAGNVDDQLDEDSLIKSLTFRYTSPVYKSLRSKLMAIKRENGLDSMADALVIALKPYKGLSGPKLRKAGQ